MPQNSSTDRILHLLKSRGPQTAAQLGEQLDITSMGARQHLQRLESDGLVERTSQPEAERPTAGRPRQFWQLTDASRARFPDRHADLTLELIASTRDVFGEEGLERLIASREQRARQQYLEAMADCHSLEARVLRLAELRSTEGYMARAFFSEDHQCWWLIEDHCPICAAATDCQGFCRAELDLFEEALGVRPERDEYLLDGGRRCSYRIRA